MERRGEEGTVERQGVGEVGERLKFAKEGTWKAVVMGVEVMMAERIEILRLGRSL